jgi:hypothetical protein
MEGMRTYPRGEEPRIPRRSRASTRLKPRRSASLKLLKAFAAINGAIAAWLEGHARLTSAVGARRREIFAGARPARSVARIRAARGAALRATGGHVGQSLAGEKFLLTGGKNEILLAVAATQGHVSSQWCGTSLE